VAERGYVMETGGITIEDSAANLLKNDRVKQCYLGIEESFI
jgi:branched-chain amino acid transport system ATP-binding protein